MKKRVTMKKIAERLNLSINAVSLALNDRAGVSEETRRLVMNAAEEMGYLDQSKRYTAAYSNKNICILLENRFFKDMQFYGRILLGVEEAAKKAGYDLFINSFENSHEIPSCVEQQKVSGIIVVGKIAEGFLKKLKRCAIPILLLDHESLETPTDCVITNNISGAYKLTTYLLDKGFSRIGFLGDLDYTPSVKERFWGYQEAMQQRCRFPSFEEGIAYIMRYSILAGLEEAVIHQDTSALAACYQSLAQQPEALLCSNDKMAILMCKALSQCGLRVPEDISVVGFDDIELSNMVNPRITTMRVDKLLMGKTAMERLLSCMDKPKERVEKLVLDVQLVERDSVKESHS